MEILLIVAVVAVGAAGLFVAVTFNARTRQNAAPLIADAVDQISGQLKVATDEMRRQLRTLTDDLQRDREQQRLDGRKIQGRLDHADSRIASVANQFLAELDAIKRLDGQIDARQDQLRVHLRQLDDRVAQLRPVPATRLYLERLQFSVIRVPPQPRSELQFRIQVERYVGEWPAAHLGDPATIAERADHDEGFRKLLGQAAADYLATKAGDPVTATAADRWVTQDTFPEMAAVEVCNRIGSGLDVIVERPPGTAGTEIRLPGPPVLVLRPATEAPGQVTRFLEISGVVAGIATGLHPLALAAGKLLARDQFYDAPARSLTRAAREVFRAPAEAPEPASSADPPQRAVSRAGPPKPQPSAPTDPGPRFPEPRHPNEIGGLE